MMNLMNIEDDISWLDNIHKTNSKLNFYKFVEFRRITSGRRSVTATSSWRSSVAATSRSSTSQGKSLG